MVILRLLRGILGALGFRDEVKLPALDTVRV